MYMHGPYDVVPAFSEEQYVPLVRDGVMFGRGVRYGVLCYWLREAVRRRSQLERPLLRGNLEDLRNGWIRVRLQANGELTTFIESDVVLWGYDYGITTLKNSKYHMNGSVEGAGEPFEDWIGRNVHMSGLIEWYPFGAPQFAPGTFRIN